MKILRNYRFELDLLESHIRALAADGRTLEILEAGCGREWYFPMKGIAYRLTGVDLDAKALHARKGEKGDLAKTVVGDIRTVELPAEEYDVIYNAFVLEHVSGAAQALERFVRWLKPGGILILRIPDRNSVHGFITRMTPFWVHVWYHRVVWGKKNAGKPGFDPYPTVHDEVISQRGIRTFAQQHGLTIVEELGQGTYARGPVIFRMLVPAFARVIALLTFGRIHDKFCDLTYVLRKS
jgi:SAM-dependent methyltransferase